MLNVYTPTSVGVATAYAAYPPSILTVDPLSETPRCFVSLNMKTIFSFSLICQSM